MGELSKAEKLLVAAGRLAAEGRTEFSAEDLVVRAHQVFPHDFSLKGYLQYPDSNVVLTQIMGKSAPLIVRGWLEKTGTKQYRLTAKGSDDLSDVDQQDKGVISVRVGRELEEGLARLLTSAAFEFFKSGQQDQITFHQFCRFVGLSARDKWQKVRGRLTSLEHLVQKAREMGEAGEGINLYVSNHNEKIEAEDLRLLSALFEFLMKRFKQEMGEWKQHALE